MGLQQRLQFWLTPLKEWQGDWLNYFAASSLIAALAVFFAQQLVPPAHPGDQKSFLDCMVRWDGTYYRDIARDGYSYKPGRQSTVHFWPLYPLLCRGVAALTGLPVECSLVLVSHLCFAAALLLLGRYVDLRYGPAAAEVRSSTLLALAFVPAGMFFHVGYTESLFLLLCVGELYLIERGVHPLAVTMVAGLAIVTRPPGVALLAPLAAYVWRRSRDRWRAAASLCTCLPLALSGLAAFLCYCDVTFHDALAPIRDRTFLWRMRAMPTLPEKVLALLTFQPGWELFDPSSPGYWLKWVPKQLLFALYPVNPFYFLAALALLTIGMVRGWLNNAEVLLTACLLLIPYWANGYETFLVSMARYTCVAPPLYLVMGRSLAPLSPEILAVLVSIGGFFLVAYAVQFAQGYFIL